METYSLTAQEVYQAVNWICNGVSYEDTARHFGISVTELKKQISM